MKIKITRRQNIYEVHNGTVGDQYYYLVHGKIYNDEYSKLKRFKFVVWFDGNDLWDFFGENYTADRILEYVNGLIHSYTSLIVDFDNCDEFYEACNKSIEHYNDMVKHTNYR